MIEKQLLIDRFISYVTIDTESDPESKTTPSSDKQWNLAKSLVDELKRIQTDLAQTYLRVSLKSVWNRFGDINCHGNALAT